MGRSVRFIFASRRRPQEKDPSRKWEISNKDHFGVSKGMRQIYRALGAILIAFPVHAGQISVADLDRLPPGDVVILGEVHDNPIQHQNQARAVGALQPKALVFEMLTPTQAANAAGVDHADANALGAALKWADSGWPDFSLYAPIFAAAPNAAIYGGNLPHGQVRRAVKQGASAVFGVDAAVYGLTQDLPQAEQTLREAGQMQAHCDALPQNLLGGMVQAQRLRDAALARAVMHAYRATGGPVVLITGNGHARRDWGVPKVLAQVNPALSVISLGQFELSVEADPPYDLFVLTPAAAREDPCLTFKKG